MTGPETRIARILRETCDKLDGAEIDVRDLDAMFRRGEELIALGASDRVLRKTVCRVIRPVTFK